MDAEAVQVTICVPHMGDSVPAYFCRSVVAMAKPNDPYWIDVGGYPVDMARNMLVMGALERPETTHVLFLDSDMMFPRETLARLVMADKPIVSGTYFARAEAPVPHVYRYGFRDDGGVYRYVTMAGEFREWMREHPEARGNTGIFGAPYLVKAAAVGAGCLLIERRVLEDVYQRYGAEDPKYPWFRNGEGSKGGEDFEFCRRAAACGYEIWADFGLQCAHEVRGGFVGREEFAIAAGIGSGEEHDFLADPIEVEGPSSGKRYMGVAG